MFLDVTREIYNLSLTTSTYTILLMSAKKAICNDKIQAVLFDVGGVVVQSPFLAISVYERQQGLPANYINVALSKRGSEGAFQRYERGELAHSDFLDQWTDELNEVESNNTAYREYLKRRHLDTRMVLPQSTRINGGVLFARMMERAQTPIRCVVQLVGELHRAGYKVAALTNSLPGAGHSNMLDEIFDEVFESSEVGLRKPDPKFYMLACNRLEVCPSEVVFLDDIGANLRAADRLGMDAVQVEIGNEQVAVDKVRKLVRSRGAHILPAQAKI